MQVKWTQCPGESLSFPRGNWGVSSCELYYPMFLCCSKDSPLFNNLFNSDFVADELIQIPHRSWVLLWVTHSTWLPHLLWDLTVGGSPWRCHWRKCKFREEEFFQMWAWAWKTSVFLQFLNFHPSSFFCLAQHVIFPYFSLGISVPPFHGVFHECWKPSRKKRVLAVAYKDQSLQFGCVCLSKNLVQVQNWMFKNISGSFSSRYSKFHVPHLGQMKKAQMRAKNGELLS